MTNGIIYVATGTDYVDLACQSAASLRASNPDLPADLFTDDLNRAGLDVFDTVHSVPRNHARAKLDCLSLSRFDRTLFLDADTLVVGDLGDVWDIADHFDFAMAHDVRRASDLIQEGLDHATPYGFPQLNSGVILYRHSDAAHRFFAEWAGRFHESGVKRDQIILKDMLWSGTERFYVLPPEFNLRRLPILDAWEPLDARVKIIHSHRLMDHMRGAGPRLSSLAELIKAEREAYEMEWAQETAPDPVPILIG